VKRIGFCCVGPRERDTVCDGLRVSWPLRDSVLADEVKNLTALLFSAQGLTRAGRDCLLRIAIAPMTYPPA
jgi:hypothetical protein